MAMQSPAVFPLVNEDDEDFAITSAGTQIGNVAGDLEGVDSLSLYAYLATPGASSGAGVTVYVQTSMAGAPWYDVACFTLGDSTTQKGAEIKSAGSNPQFLTDQALADDTAIDGPLGDRLRAVVVTEGDFTAPSTLAIRAHAR